MFQKIRYRLLLSYLAVLASILVVFAIAVRFVFAYSLRHYLVEELRVLGKAAAASAEMVNGRLIQGDDFPIGGLTARDEALQWFDLKGRMITQQGEDIVTVSFDIEQPIQTQWTGQERVLAVSLPIVSSDNHQLIGYVRASESLELQDKTLEKLDWGLGSGIVIALALSGIGGIWLTRQAMKPAEQGFEKLRQFTADASHELRSPLTAIKSNASVALKYAEEMRSSDAEKFEAIASATNQMIHLTEDLLLLARTDQIANLKLTQVNLTEVLDQLVIFYQSQAEAKHIKLIAQLQPDLFVSGNFAQLSRAFANLIENALHYTPDGGTIEIQTRCSNRYLWVSVQDSGIGIATENLERIFDRFWRVDQSRSRWAGGSGLGLSIVQAIVQKHDGSIAVTSQPDVGSCFTVRLPALAKETIFLSS